MVHSVHVVYSYVLK